MTRTPPPSWRWVVLTVGTLSQAATCVFLYGIPLLLPALRTDEHLSLVAATIVVSSPTAGLLFTLYAWGALADRVGERVVMASGTGIAAIALLGASQVHGQVPLCLLLFVAGAGGGSINAASGRVVMGWFAKDQRGLAMGLRQTAQPLGVAFAGLGLPPLARAWDVHEALLLPALLCGVASLACATLVVDPTRAPAVPGAVTENPYRTSRTLVRVHAAATMLCVPQMAVATFTAIYLVSQRHWAAVEAGQLVAVFQLVGAGGRIFSGVWSDRVGSRLRPMRQLAWTSAALMGLLALGAGIHAMWIVPVFGVAAVITVADNGLAYTSVAELAGSAWSGRALGAHNTCQNLFAVITAPTLALVIGNHRYAWAFALVVIPPLLAVPLTPVGAEGQDGRRGAPGVEVAAAQPR